MAMYEQLGFCPSNAFFMKEISQEKLSKNWKEVKEILGDRVHYMVYKTGEPVHEDASNIVDALMNAESESRLGIEVATTLRDMIPNCTYGEIGRRIECTDIEYPAEIPWKLVHENDQWRIVGLRTNDSKVMKLIEDGRYIVGIADTADEVHIYLYRK